MAPSVEEYARAQLVAMLSKLSANPHAALGISADADAAVTRSAFMDLTKQFHPQKFARLSPDTVKLANEVFLRLREAHDLVQKQLALLGAGGTVGRTSGTLAAVQRPSGTGATGNRQAVPVRAPPPSRRTRPVATIPPLDMSAPTRPSHDPTGPRPAGRSVTVPRLRGRP